VVTGSMCPIVESARVLLRVVWPVRQIACNCGSLVQERLTPSLVRYSVRFFGGSGGRAPVNGGRIKFSLLRMFVLADSVNCVHSSTGPTRPAGPATRRTSSPLGAARHAAATTMGTARYVTGSKGRGFLFSSTPVLASDCADLSLFIILRIWAARAQGPCQVGCRRMVAMHQLLGAHRPLQLGYVASCL
jgi:hypothetical protein